jgi:hypothetical protein
MKCEWAKGNVPLYVYDELPDDARHELEQHLARCARCAAELEAMRSFHARVGEFAVDEPSPNLIAASRMRLQEALETTEQDGFWQRLMVMPTAWFEQVKFSPALTAAVLMVGFALGALATYKSTANRNPDTATAEPGARPSEASISGIRSVTQQPGNRVSINYDTISTQQTQGSLDDQRIQQLLLFAARNNYNSGVRMDSVDLLTQQPSNPQLREALIYSLRYDSNPGVRLKVLQGLGPYVKEDLRVRDSVLEALMSDSNPGVRTLALQLLEPVRADGSVRLILEELAKNDHNPYIRSQARMLIAQLPEID